jgi:hypothetical protein
MKQRLSEYLPDLLTHFECVIIPQFGGFVVQSQNNEGPKKILFNANLNHNDGLLANYIAQKENISYAAAMEEISQEVDLLYTELEGGAIISIGTMGNLRSLNDRLIFKSSVDDVGLYDAFGLGELKSKAEPLQAVPEVRIPAPTPAAAPVQRTITPPKEEEETYKPTIDPRAQERQAKIEAKRQKRDSEVSIHLFKKNVKRYVVPTILALIILLLISSVYVLRDRLFQIGEMETSIDSSLLLEKEGLKSLADTLKEMPEPIVKARPKPKYAAPVESNTDEIAENTDPNVVSSDNTQEIYYCVASGSFGNETEAFKEKRNLDMIGFTGDVIEIKNGTRFQVIIGRYDSYEKAVTELKFAKSIDSRFYLLTVKPYRK